MRNTRKESLRMLGEQLKLGNESEGRRREDREGSRGYRKGGVGTRWRGGREGPTRREGASATGNVAGERWEGRGRQWVVNTVVSSLSFSQKGYELEQKLKNKKSFCTSKQSVYIIM